MSTLTLFRAYKLAMFHMESLLESRGHRFGIGVRTDPCALQWQRYEELAVKLDKAITARLEHEAGQARLGRMVRNMTFGMHLVHAFYGAGPYENDSGWEVHCAGEHEYAMSPEGALDKAEATA